MNTELSAIAAQVMAAEDYLDLFGSCDGSTSEQARHVKKIHRQLARVLHPDRYSDDDSKTTAHTAFTRLQELQVQAEKALADNAYGQPVLLATVTSRKAKHEIIRAHRTGDLGTVYLSRTTKDTVVLETVCKVTSDQGNNDLMQVEARVLKHLHAAGTDDKWHPYVPELVDSFTYSEPGRPRRQANVIARLDGFYTLAEVRKAFPAGLNPLDMAWIWRRTLVALGYVHQQGVIHGAVLPEHIMILPQQHGLVLVDWCYASLADDGGDYSSIKAIVGAHKDWYPDEVTAQAAPSPATDIAMAARCMVELLGGDPLTGNLPAGVPRGMRAFFKGCLQTKQAARPNDAWWLLGEFDELLERLGSPYYPRKFRPFTMPTGN